MNEMKDVEVAARKFADAHSALVGEVTELEDEIVEAKRRHAVKLRRAAKLTATARTVLALAIEDAADLFEKPKTRILSGVKCGFRKKKGSVEMRDEADTIDRIKRLLPEDQVLLLIRTRESVDRNAAADLAGADLKRLAIEIMADADEVVIQPPHAAIARAAEALIRDADKLEHAA